MKSVKNSGNLKKKIVDTAKYCARKFVHPYNQAKKQYFMNYCINRASKLSNEEPIPSTLERGSFNNILDVYDKVFYNIKLKGGSSEAGANDQTTEVTTVHPSDEGIYICEATNIMGSITTKASLKVREPPVISVKPQAHLQVRKFQK